MQVNDFGRESMKLQGGRGSDRSRKLIHNKEAEGSEDSGLKKFADKASIGSLASIGNIAAGAAMAGAAASLLTPGLAMGTLGASGALIGGIIGASVGMWAGGVAKYSGLSGQAVEITKSGVHRTRENSNDKTEINLPTGVKIEHGRHQGEISDLKAFNADGKELKAELTKDKDGNQIIQVRDGHVTTELNTRNLEMKLSAKTVTTSDSQRTSLQQTVRADGSMQFIVGEEASFARQTVESPIKKGEFNEEIVPQHHSYTQVDITADGDSSVSRVDENYRVSRDRSGKLSAKRKTFSDWISAKLAPKLATGLQNNDLLMVSTPGKNKALTSLTTGLNTAASMTPGSVMSVAIGDGSQATMAVPFVTRDQMKEAHSKAVAERVDKFAKNMKEPVAIDGERGTTVLADLGGGRIQLVGENGEKQGNAYLGGGIAAPPLVDKGIFVADKHNRLHGFDSYGAKRWDVQLGGDMLGEPTFNKDGDITVLVDKDSRIAARTFGKDGKLKETRLLQGDPAALRTPEQVKARQERADRKEFLSFVADSLKSEGASIPELADKVGLKIENSTHIMLAASDSGVMFGDNPSKSLAEGGKKNLVLQDTLEKTLVDYLNTDEGGAKFFEAVDRANPKPATGEMAEMVENMQNAAAGKGGGLAEQRMREYYEKHPGGEEPKELAVVPGARTFDGGAQELADGFSGYLKG